MKEILRLVIYIALAAAAMALFIESVTIALDRQAVVDCLKLKDQSTSGYVNFYITRGEADQCNAAGIIINAPIK